jgi:hypothetical protein
MMGLIAAAPARNRTAAPLWQIITLRANANGMYVSADQNLANVQLIANRATAGGWEQFTVVDAGGGFVALRASNGLYVSADTNLAAYAPLVANRAAVGGWEQFTWMDAGAGQVTLKANSTGKFVSADQNRNSYLVADRATAGGWETFTWAVVGAPPTATPTATPTTGPTSTPTRTNTPVASTNLALNKPASSSSNETSAYTPNLAVDGNTTTRWSSLYSDPQWLQVDLGATATITRVVLRWETAYASAFQIQTSNDAANWTTIQTVTGNTSTLNDMSVSGSGRYVRMYGTTRATQWGYSLYEFEVYGTSGPTLTPTATATGSSTPPNFGSNVIIFDPSMSTSSIQSQINSVYSIQQGNQFGSERYALLFKPGNYSGLDIPVGFYTQVAGLGASPDNVNISANLRSDAFLSGNNATCNFWRGVENLSITPSGGTMQWAVAQATFLRRIHVRGNIRLDQNGGWSSGGWMSDDLIDGNVNSGTQQQWISRNTQWDSWTGSNWNMVFVGDTNAPGNTWPSPPYTTVGQVPVVREKPFLQIDGSGNYSVRVPSLKTNSSGYDWAGGSTPGTDIPISQFYVARAGTDTAATINAQLAAGKNLFLTPGIYGLNGTIQVTHANTVVLGLGYATLRPDTGLAAMTVGDVDGVIVAGVLFDAGTTNSPVLLEVGTNGNTTSYAANPISLHDVFFRVGGAAVGKASVSLRVNAYNTIVDHTWIWRADHGNPGAVGWSTNTGANGLVVNGANVTIYGLFVEHYQQYQVLWNGNGGRVYFYQSELPYDPPNQSGWSSGSGVNGWASYKVADSVTSHEAWGLGIYSVFTNGGIFLTRAIEVPNNANVRFHDMITVCLGANGGISNVINNTGGSTSPNVGFTPKVTNFP